MDVHIRELLDTMIWKITEADGKEKTCYQTRLAMTEPTGVKRQHEHVYQKKKMLLMTAKHHEIDQILASACGCYVTKEEHDRMRSFDVTMVGVATRRQESK
jgi:hypothetical protein